MNATALETPTSYFQGVGQSFSTRDFREALEQCGLNFTVSQHKNIIVGADVGYRFDHMPDGRSCIVFDKESEYTGLEIPEQAPIVRDDHLHGLINLGRGYKIIQNDECAAIIDDLIQDNEEIEIVHGGSFKDCERCFIAAKLPDPIRVGKDVIDKYVIVHWSHTGRAALSVRFSPVLRTRKDMIFMDTFAGNSQYEFKIRHTKKGPQRLKEATNILQKAYKYFSEIEKVFKKIKSERFTDEDMQKYLDYLLPNSKNDDEDENKKQRKSVNEGRRAKIMELFQEERSTIGNQWDALVSVCRWTDQEATVKTARKNPLTDKPRYSDEEMRLDNIWFGTGAKTKGKAFKALIDFA